MDGKLDDSSEKKIFVSPLWRKSHSKQGKRPTTQKISPKKFFRCLFFISVWLNISKVCPDSCSLHQDFKEFSQGWFIFFIIIFFAKGRFDRLHEISKFPQSFKVVLGEHDSDREDETFLETKRFRVKNVIIHEEYVGDFKNDSIGRVGGRHGPPP